MSPPLFIPPSTLVSTLDWSFQIALLLATIVHPWFLRPGQGTRAFWTPALIGYLWAIWRIFYFDPLTDNDIPGMGYIVVSIFYGLIAYLIHTIRSLFRRRRTKSTTPTNP